jgi:hypothetical protein
MIRAGDIVEFTVDYPNRQMDGENCTVGQHAHAGEGPFVVIRADGEIAFLYPKIGKVATGAYFKRLRVIGHCDE